MKIKNDIDITIATASHRRAPKWKNTATTWSALLDTLKDTERTDESVKQYFNYTKDKQDDIKDKGGFVGGRLKDGRRKKDSVMYRQVVALDVDFGDLDMWIDFGLLNMAGCMYTTHKHTPESPRFRIVFPLDRKVSPDEYEAIARTVAAWLGIDNFDDTTYQPNRLMYYPTTSKDGEYIFNYTDAPVCVADEVLAELEDWKDPTTWARSSRENERHTHDRKAESADPTEKNGVIGAFCRVYPVSSAIAEFLTAVYTPCDALGADRYTYAGGSTSGGLIVYEDLHAFSHHSTDPISGQLCNAFDLVRLHKFADLDTDKAREKAGDDVTKLPSYKAMCDFAGSLKEVKLDIIQQRREAADIHDYDEAEEGARKRGVLEDWVDKLETEGKKGTIKNTINNAVLILQNDEYLEGRFGFNEFEQREVAMKQLHWDKKGQKYPRALRDTDDSELRLYFETAYGFTGKGQLADALAVVVRANIYHPVKDYLDACQWDGVERLDTLFIRLFGAEDTAYTRAVTRKSFTAAVARIYDAGCKYDQVPILVGEQGTGKSTTLARMGGEWFSDSLTTFTGKEAMEQVQGAWIIEIGELTGLKKSEVNDAKHFIGKTEDQFRVAYGKRKEYFPRRCVFFGTTNEDDFLRDVTGNRRFWVINCKGREGSEYFADYLTKATIAQLWAEAKERYNDGEALYLDSPELEEQAREIQDAHLEQDDRAGMVREYLDRALPEDWDNLHYFERRAWLEDTEAVGTIPRDKVCIIEIWAECLCKDPNSITRRDSMELGRILKGFRDWQKWSTLRFTNYGNQKSYKPKTKNQASENQKTKKPK